MANIDDYPIVLNVNHISEILGCSESTAYAIMRQSDFPINNLGGQKKGIIRVYRDSFFKWLRSKEQNYKHIVKSSHD